MVTNVMSLSPKIVEVQEFVIRNQISLAFITETWLRSIIPDSVVDISGYTILRKDRASDNHGGVCLYIKNDCFKYTQLNELSCCNDHEILWVQIRPNRLPRGFSSLIVAVVYHPQWTGYENDLMREHLFQSLSIAESRYPNCALIVAGDFNRLDVNSIKKHFNLKQIVKKPTRKDVILDLVLTNMYKYYKEPRLFPPFGLSDHNTVTAEGKARDSCRSTTFVSKRDKRASRKAELGRYLGELNWPTLFLSTGTCEDLVKVFNEVVHTGFDLLMPIKKVRVNLADAPWMTQHLKSLILKRQKAFHKHGTKSPQYKFYRNFVNRERKVCKAKFYKSKIEHMKKENPRAWWKEVKRLCGGQFNPVTLTNHIQVEGVEDLSMKELADAINASFLEPLEEYRLPQALSQLPLDDELAEFPEVSESRIQTTLAKLNPMKACGPDGIPNWLLKDYADLLAFPITKIINASFKEQRLPRIWKIADVSPLPKTKPVKNLKKDLRPISLTACLSKVAEDFIVRDYVKPAVLKIIDPHQYGTVPKSSTTQALIHMIHNWAKETDGNGATVRTILFDYRKAFDLIDHSILLKKLCNLELPRSVVNWIIDFLSNRLQRIKLADGCFSEWGSVPSGVPQGTKLGPWLFLVLINDLDLSDNLNANIWKYVDDTTTSEVVPKGNQSNAQSIADCVAQWSNNNRVKLNSDKCKELRISFARDQPEFQPILLNGKNLEVVKSAKLLGVTITSNLLWNDHINDIVKKASKRLYFLVQLKRAKLPLKELVLFYTTCIRSVVTYAIPVFFYALPKYLQNELERVQKRAFSIISPGITYIEALEKAGIPTIISYSESMCHKVFNSIVGDKDNKLLKLLPATNHVPYDLRENRYFAVPEWKTNRFRNTFIMSSCIMNNG